MKFLSFISLIASVNACATETDCGAGEKCGRPYADSLPIGDPACVAADKCKESVQARELNEEEIIMDEFPDP